MALEQRNPADCSSAVSESEGDLPVSRQCSKKEAIFGCLQDPYLDLSSSVDNRIILIIC